MSLIGDLACSWRSREDENGEEIAACLCLWCTESGHVVRELSDLTWEDPDIKFSPGGECITYDNQNQEGTRVVLLRTLEDHFEQLPALDRNYFVGFLPYGIESRCLWSIPTGLCGYSVSRTSRLLKGYGFSLFATT